MFISSFQLSDWRCLIFWSIKASISARNSFNFLKPPGFASCERELGASGKIPGEGDKITGFIWWFRLHRSNYITSRMLVLFPDALKRVTVSFFLERRRRSRIFPILALFPFPFWAIWLWALIFRQNRRRQILHGVECAVDHYAVVQIIQIAGYDRT